MREYINTRTGTVIRTPHEISAEGWREVKPAALAAEKEPGKKGTKAK